MYTDTQKNEFVTLRAEGLSFDKISTKLKIPKRTLIRWSQVKKKDIDTLKEAAFESIMESLKIDTGSRLKMLVEDLNNINNAIKHESFTRLYLKDMLKFKMKLINEISKLDPSVKSINKDTDMTVDLEDYSELDAGIIKEGEKFTINHPAIQDIIAVEKEVNKTLGLFDDQNED
jgi:hypothetical protein